MSCGSVGYCGFCQPCLAELPWNFNACMTCAAPLNSADYSQPTCELCRRQPAHWLRAYSIFEYHFPIDRMLLALKFQKQLGVARVLGLACAWYLEKKLALRTEPRPDLIVPVPLHRRRLAERGFNQAHELGRWIANSLRLPFSSTLCRRTRATLAQSHLTASQRRQNLKRAFTVHRSAHTNMPTHIAIVDDVMTTMTTATELADTLKDAGTRTVEIWACARARLDYP
ncbi:MAG: ComF family protein [Gammaproteobacteria bacterium]|nr:ComF family protein [Gammaproteobacteria bacterium]